MYAYLTLLTPYNWCTVNCTRQSNISTWSWTGSKPLFEA